MNADAVSEQYVKRYLLVVDIRKRLTFERNVLTMLTDCDIAITVVLLSRRASRPLSDVARFIAGRCVFALNGSV